MSKSSKVKLLKNYFQKRDDVLMAFLFGSQAKNIGTDRSDWDIGIYLKPNSKTIEWENERDYLQENKIRGDLIDILETDNIDLIILNRAPASIAATVLNGSQLIIKDRKLYLEFMLIVTSAAIDYRQMVEEYYAIFQRSQSLNDEDRVALKDKIMFLENELADFKQFEKLTWQEYFENRNARRSAERWIENLVNCGLDISKMLLASEHKQVPSTYKKIFLHLQFFSQFSQDLAEKLASWADLRNILAHEYLDIAWQKIKNFIKEAEPCFDEFLNAVKKFTK